MLWRCHAGMASLSTSRTAFTAILSSSSSRARLAQAYSSTGQNHTGWSRATARRGPRHASTRPLASGPHPDDRSGMRPLEDAPYLDIFDPAFIADPAPTIDAIRRESPLARTPIGVLVVRHANVTGLLADPRLHSSLLDFVKLQGLTEGPIYDSVATSILAVDGPDHTRLRKLVSRAFTPRAVERLRP